MPAKARGTWSWLPSTWYGSSVPAASIPCRSASVRRLPGHRRRLPPADDCPPSSIDSSRPACSSAVRIVFRRDSSVAVPGSSWTTPQSDRNSSWPRLEWPVFSDAIRADGTPSAWLRSHLPISATRWTLGPECRTVVEPTRKIDRGLDKLVELSSSFCRVIIRIS